MQLEVERKSVRLWGNILLHLNDEAQVTFNRLKKKGVEVIMTGGSYVIVTKKGEDYSYVLEFDKREPEAELIKIERQYNGKSWYRPSSVVVWKRLYE